MKSNKLKFLFAGLAGAMILTPRLCLAQASEPEFTPDSVLRNAAGESSERTKIAQNKIKSVSAWRFEAVAGRFPEKGAQLSSTEYDRKGNAQVKNLFNPQGGMPARTRYQYDEKGHLKVTVSEIAGNEGLDKAEYQYDEQNRIKSVTNFASDGSLAQSIAYEYGATGKLTNLTRSDRTGASLMHFDYTATGKPERVTMRQGKEGGASSEMAFSYEPNGFGKYTQIIKDGKGHILMRSQSSFDKKGNMIDMVKTDGAGKVLAEVHGHFDQEGNLTRRTILSGAGKVTWQTDRKYDNRGNVIEEITNRPAAKIQTRVTWRYDGAGNRIEEIRYNKLDQPVEAIRYQYEYYKN